MDEQVRCLSKKNLPTVMADILQLFQSHNTYCHREDTSRFCFRQYMHLLCRHFTEILQTLLHSILGTSIENQLQYCIALFFCMWEDIKSVTTCAVMGAFRKPETIDNPCGLEVLHPWISWIIIMSILEMENLNTKEVEDLFKLKSQFKESGIDSSSQSSN